MEEGKATMSDGRRIAWRLDGPEGAPLLLLCNSLGTDREMWAPQVPALTRRFRVLRYDTRGHGRSDAPSGDYGLDRLGRDALELLDAHGVERARFCGVSLGGMTGQWLAVHAPERLDRLILANTAAYMGPPEAWQGRMDSVRAQGMAAIAEAVIARWFTPDYLAGAPAAVERLRETLLACRPEGYAGCCAAIRDMDLRPVIGLIARPTLVVSGARDPATPPEQGAAIAAAIAGAERLTLDAAHLSNIEQAEQFNRAALDFLG